ncbi:glycosyltransferase family 2 protein [Bifidobacterium dentium]|uniref:glycosyltransferase family 2 protein n=1 Tax=Bifidobacterium dentium TaxID=1689 RepID=UPI0018C3418A|nr:glycosyltransferase family 2 protein [Bifidobacterium dentium]MBF9696806.1 glycosyltransferase family 2 protein [Bifidobacterium dentium]MBF9712966.1 glycosyltransferase family 2 protein [Bifidobacterium dentium]MBF9714927.1 glycosyltransferase family 2 protein [Bifidobacterium dentium]MBF9718904.1 glycosyltransferase family 2 protein [Bifidobacterium dentium]
MIQSSEDLDSLAIIILNYCSSNDVIDNVKRLLSFHKSYRIIIVDNYSPDNSFRKIRNFFRDSDQVDVLQTGSNLGYAAGNNYGIRYAAKHYSIETIAIMNPDVVLSSSDVIEKMCALLYSDMNCIFVGGCPLNHYDGDKPMPMGWDIPSLLEIILNSCLFVDSADEKHQRRCMQTKAGIYRVECVTGCFFVAKYSLFKKIVFFDEGTFLYNEENILGIKARKSGYYSLVDTNLKYYHNHRVGKEIVSLQRRLSSIDAGFTSRVYLAKNYYSKSILPFLYLIHIFNKVFLFLSWLKDMVIGSMNR